MNFEATAGLPVLTEKFQSIFQDLSAGSDDRDKRKSVGKEEIRKLATAGMFGLALPQELGGQGGALSDIIEIIRGLAHADAGIALVVGTHNVLSLLLHKSGYFEQQNSDILSKFARGENLLSSAFQEYGYSADPDNLDASSVLIEENYELNGTKVWVPCGDFADFVLVSVSSANGDNQQGQSYYLVETNQKGVAVTAHNEPLGFRSANLCKIQFQQCKISSTDKLENSIDSLARTGIYIVVSAVALGVAETVLERSCIYANQRHQFDQPIGNFEAIRDKLADMAVLVESASSLLTRAIRKWENGNANMKYAAMSKLATSKAAMFSANEALQIHGGYGYLRENEIERFLRDAKMVGIIAATDETIREIVAREVLKSGSQ